MVKVILWSVVAALFFSLVQATVLSNITILSAIPDLVLLFVIYISLENGSVAGCTAGFFAGIIMDFISAAPLGMSSMAKTITGFVTGKFSSAFNLQRLLIPIVAAFIATFLKALLIFVMAFFFGDKIMRYRIASPVLWIEAIANAVCAPLMFMLLNAFKPLFTLKERGQAK